MEEAIRKQGVLYLQQQRFGKKWKKVWSTVYGESTCSIARMEFFECKDSGAHTEKPDKALRKQENKKVIKLSDCIRVSEVEMDGCPKDCVPFLVETTEKLFVFAAESAELEDWTQKLCETAFPMNWNERPSLSKRNSLQHSVRGDSSAAPMEENSLYNTRESVKEFKVTIRKTEATERCRLRGTYILRADFENLVLKDTKTGEALYTWPYRFLRRFGRDKVTFSFEAGRRCTSGEGNFEFETRQGNSLFQAIESAINVQKSTLAHHMKHFSSTEGDALPSPRSQAVGASGTYSMVSEVQGEVQQGSRQRMDLPSETLLSGVKSLTLDSRSTPRKPQVKTIASCPILSQEDQTYSQISMAPGEPLDHGKDRGPQKSQGKSSHRESEYAVPFDTIAKNLASTFRTFSIPTPEETGSERGRGKVPLEAPDPLYDSIDESAMNRAKIHKPAAYTRAEHIYDEPEGCAVAAATGTSLYDDPEEVKGYAWKLQAASMDPAGHEYPYNPSVDDYAVPKPPKKVLSTEESDEDVQDQEEENLDTTYDNVMIKSMEKMNKK
ncbi:docking protein 2 [Lepisosteus oculatus]|uniref:docking protein 2 n=1 Tax=Lepisosteus oculatus TaxID=7918 RepID=UPI0035F52B87